ncbi:MAG: rcc01693 family protein [Pseudomonadota bacterium]
MRFDWPVLLKAAVNVRGLRPAEFWALTPAELSLMLGRAAGLRPLDRADLDALLSAYPDKEES